MHRFGHQKDNRHTGPRARDQNARVLERAVEETGGGIRETGVKSDRQIGKFLESGAGRLIHDVDLDRHLGVKRVYRECHQRVSGLVKAQRLTATVSLMWVSSGTLTSTAYPPRDTTERDDHAGGGGQQKG
jgi:hypothetical protein